MVPLEPFSREDFKEEFTSTPQLPVEYAGTSYTDLRIHLKPKHSYETEEENAFRRYAGSGVALASLVAENLLSHPFVVLRRQCQVHPNSQRYHLQPFTLFPTIYHLHQHQGLTTLWKGLGSVVLVRGMSLGVEDFLSKVTPWPKDINWHSNVKQFCQHILLKCVSFAVMTPFYSASFVETVQSEIASEKSGILDVFREGFMRLLHWGAPTKGRMLPIWALVVPTVTLGLAKYLLSLSLKGVTRKIIMIKLEAEVYSDTLLEKGIIQEAELTSSIVAAILADIVFYPCETVLHRLLLQGTRTIVDNLDNGRTVLPILTSYTGAVDCYDHCLSTEGYCGLYKGFGALILQYAAHLALLRLAHCLISLLNRPKPRPKIWQELQPIASTSSITFT